MISPTAPNPRARKPIGLRYWMLRVLEECEHVSADFSPDPVHDLRVSLRRCRSLADGLHALDPDPNWKAMRKAGKRLFQRLGALRDIQIMMEWIEKLHPAEVNVKQAREKLARVELARGERALLHALRPAQRNSEFIPKQATEQAAGADPAA